MMNVIIVVTDNVICMTAAFIIGDIITHLQERKVARRKQHPRVFLFFNEVEHALIVSRSHMHSAVHKRKLNEAHPKIYYTELLAEAICGE